MPWLLDLTTVVIKIVNQTRYLLFPGYFLFCLLNWLFIHNVCHIRSSFTWKNKVTWTWRKWSYSSLTITVQSLVWNNEFLAVNVACYEAKTPVWVHMDKGHVTFLKCRGRVMTVYGKKKKKKIRSDIHSTILNA